jgi:hypothetical protein|tara:strand:+ start:134 stop:481 length:348 start_codon:yes stop_codon:yes gene_type:complete
MKHADTKLEFHSRVARQLKRVMSKYNFQVYNSLIVEWRYGLDISCILNLYKGALVCTGVRFVHYSGKKKPSRFRMEEMEATFSPEQVAINIAKRIKNIISSLSTTTKFVWPSYKT